MDVTIKNMRCSIFLSVAIVTQLAACSMQPGLPKGSVDQPPAMPVNHAAQLAKAPSKTESAQTFEGEWSYRSDCDRGHYVTLYIKSKNGHLIGSWSDGTLVRGSQGQLRGRIDQDRLVIERCSDSEEAGGPALCPAYQKSQDYLIADGDTLAWYQKLGPEPAKYVVLSKGIDPHQPMEACDEDQQGAEQ